VTSSGGEALQAAMKFAVRRPLAAGFAFERRRVQVDMSALNAASFALWGYLRNEGGEGEPTVAWIDGEPGWRERGTAPPWVKGDAAFNASVPPWERRL
jgi:hypothetical protein